jgi:tripartite-type tricarboxylate transporter receptor subunit TctC
MLRRRAVLQGLSAFALPSGLGSAWAEAPYPNKPITVIVPAAAGGGSDTCARAVAEKMRQIIGTPLIVDNRAGATGDIGLRAVGSAAPDGYTLCNVSAANTANEAARPDKSYSVTSNLRPIGKVGVSAFTLVVARSLGVKSVEEFIEYAKARPGKLCYGSVGPGSSQHLVMEMFCAAAGMQMTHVPYRGEIKAVPDLIEGNIHAMFMAGAKPFVSSGKILGLATTNRTTWPSMPELRPIGDSAALKGFYYNGWNGLMVPTKTPDAIVRKLSSALVLALRDETTITALRTASYEPGKGTPEDLADHIRAEVVNFKRIITERHLTFPD